MLDFSNLPIHLVLTIFFVAGIIIAIFGSMLTRIADQLADVTGVGEAMMGAIFLGGTTSLPGIITSVTAAYEGYAELAISNAIGGIAAQTVFLAIADIVYRKSNLEHAAASIANMMQGALLIILLSLAFLGMTGPQVAIFQIHPITVILIIGYVFGLRQISQAQTEPMWRPRRTGETLVDKTKTIKMTRLTLILTWIKFAVLGAVVGFAGYVVAQSGIAISNTTGISQTIVGGLFTAITTSLPELVTSISAVRQGALTLAVGGVIGGNSFDVLFLAFADMAYRDGSVYAGLTTHLLFMISLAILLTGILLLGLLRREKYGIGNIGFESFLILVLYIVAIIFLFMSH